MDGPDSSKLSGPRAPLLFPRSGASVWLGILLAASFLLATGLVLIQKLSPEYLLLGFLLPVILARYFNRFIYLAALILVAITNGILISLRGDALKAILVAFIGMGIAGLIGEIIYRLARAGEKAQEARARELERLEHLLRLSQDGLALLNSRGQVEGWNRSMEDITAMPQATVRGRHFWDAAYRFLPADRRNHAVYEEVRNELRELSENGQPPSGCLIREKEIFRPNGAHRTILEVMFPLFSPGGGGLGVIYHDFSERKQMEQNLQTANEMLLGTVYELQERNQEMSLLNELGGTLLECEDAGKAFEAISSYNERIFAGLSGCLFIFNENVNLFERKAVWGQPAGEMDSFGMEGCWAIKKGRVHVVKDVQVDPICHHLDFPGRGAENLSYLCLPMTAHGETIGILHIRAGQGSALEQSEQTAQAASARIAMVLANLRLQERLSTQAIRDPLTGLFNRRYMEVTCEREMRRAIRDGNSLGVVMLDIDHFQHFNDIHGWDLGNAILKEIGAYLQSNVRGEDIVCRMGGEEFVVILPRATLEIANRRADQFRIGIGELRIAQIGQTIGPICVSAGTAGFPEHGPSVEAIFKAAESALRKAKSEGGDRVAAAEL